MSERAQLQRASGTFVVVSYLYVLRVVYSIQGTCHLLPKGEELPAFSFENWLILRAMRNLKAPGLGSLLAVLLLATSSFAQTPDLTAEDRAAIQGLVTG